MNQMFRTKRVGESLIYTWNFYDVAISGLTGPSIAKATITGDDPSAGTLTVGTPTVDGTNVTAKVTAGATACSYTLTCTVTDSATQVLQIKGALTVNP